MDSKFLEICGQAKFEVRDLKIVLFGRDPTAPFHSAVRSGSRHSLLAKFFKKTWRESSNKASIPHAN